MVLSLILGEIIYPGIYPLPLKCGHSGFQWRVQSVHQAPQDGRTGTPNPQQQAMSCSNLCSAVVFLWVSWILAPCVFIQDSAKDLGGVCMQMLGLSSLWLPPSPESFPQAAPLLPPPTGPSTSLHHKKPLSSPDRLQTFGVFSSSFYPIVPSQCH